MPKRRPTVSVIIPTYNSSGTLRFALQTVLLQDFKDFEVWVIGDGCTDDSEDVVASFEDERINWSNLRFNSGHPSIPRNEGLRLSDGQLIAYLGHDDLWLPWHLSELVDCIGTSNSDFVYSLGSLLTPKGVVGTFSIRPQFSIGFTISPSNWLHRKRLIEVVGSWSEKIKYGDDLEFLHRILSTNIKFQFRRRLSVLNFPSSEWHMYSCKADFPQTKYVQAISKDPEKLHDELLLDFASFMSHKRCMFYEHRNIFQKFLLGLMVRTIDLYKPYRWPLSRLLYRRWQRKTGLSTS